MPAKRLSHSQFLERAIEKHSDRYNYSLSEYKTIRNPIKIICKKHGVFEQTPYNHLLGYGCNLCGNYYDKITPIDEFIRLSNLTHDNKYDYSLIDYKNSKTKVKIICKKHGVFEQTPKNHLKGCGCPKCGINFSKGEEKIEKWLSDHNINYKTQYKFFNCKNINQLPFDFFLPDYNLCIEFDGKYHYEPVHEMVEFLKISKRDKIKDKFCIDNNIKLIRIPYWDFHKIDEIMTNMIFINVKTNLKRIIHLTFKNNPHTQNHDADGYKMMGISQMDKTS